MEYLDQICNETLRLEPVSMYMSKICTEDIAFNFSKHDDRVAVVEKGILMVIPVMSLHRDPQHYSDPESFDPDRFSADKGGAKYYKDKGVFLPFGDGPRICLGMRFALAQSKAAIVEVVENFELESSSKVQFPLTIAPMNYLNIIVGGLWAKFRPLKLTN
jgi:cytochrome P450